MCENSVIFRHNNFLNTLLEGKVEYVPGVDEAALEPDSSSEELWPELLFRLLLVRSGTDTLAEVDLVTDVNSTFSWVFWAALFWLVKRRKQRVIRQKYLQSHISEFNLVAFLSNYLSIEIFHQKFLWLSKQVPHRYKICNSIVSNENNSDKISQPHLQDCLENKNEAQSLKLQK